MFLVFEVCCPCSQGRRLTHWKTPSSEAFPTVISDHSSLLAGFIVLRFCFQLPHDLLLVAIFSRVILGQLFKFSLSHFSYLYSEQSMSIYSFVLLEK